MDIEEIRKRAQDENTAPEILAELADSKDYLTRQYVTANPNTPTKTLLNLGAEFPKELLDNPIFDLLLLENPNLISKIPITTLRSLIKQDNVPESFIVEYAERESNEEVLLGITSNPKVSRNIIEKLTISKFPEVSEAANLHINWSGEITEGWQELAEEKIKAIRPLYSGAATRIKHLQYERPYLSKLAKLGYIPEFLILHWQQRWNKQAIFSSIASSNKTTPKVLAVLGKDRSSLTRRFVALNLKTPIETLEHLSQVNTEKKLIDGAICPIKLNLCRNPNSSSTVLDRLSDYKNYGIRALVAEHSNCSFKTLEKLADDKNIQVRHKVAKNINTSLSTLKKMIKFNHSNSVATKALQLYKLKNAYLIDSKSSPIKRVFIYTPNSNQNHLLEQWIEPGNIKSSIDLSIELLDEEDKYTECNYLIIRLIVLLNVKTSKKNLEKFSVSLHWLERYAIAQNSNTPLDIIKKLKNDANKIVRAAAKDNLEKKYKS